MMSEDSSAAGTDNRPPSWLSEVPQDEHLDSDDDSVHEDYTIPYDQYLATKETQDVPTEASPIPPTAAYMLQTNKEATIASLTSETKTVLSEKKTLEDTYLEEIVCLKNANQVATGLGLSNPWFGRKAQLAQPTLYDGHRLLQPGHAPVTVSDSHETLLKTEVSRMKMSQKPGHVTPVDYTKLNALDPPKPMTPFVYTRPVNSEVHTKVWKIKECLTPFEEVIKKRTAPPSDVLYHREYNCIKKVF
nr:hypothetical protein [Tanacetum cinerariifolium]